MNGETDVAVLADEIKGRRKEREREAEDRAAHDAAAAIVSARAELKAASAEVKRTAKAAQDVQGEYEKATKKANAADNKRAEYCNVPGPDYDEIKAAGLKAEVSKLAEIQDAYGRRCFETAGVYGGALEREAKAREALAKAEAVLQ